MSWLDMLARDHKRIFEVLREGRERAEAVLGQKKVDVALIKSLIAFCSDYVDACHQAKEENLLIPRMRSKGAEVLANPVDVMLLEHRASRRLIKIMTVFADATVISETERAGAISDSLGSYLRLLEIHIQNEDQALFPLMDNYFDGSDRRYLESSFTKLETLAPDFPAFKTSVQI